MNESELYRRAKEAALELLGLDAEERQSRLDVLRVSEPKLAAEVESWLSHLGTDTDHLAPHVDGEGQELASLFSKAGLAGEPVLAPPREFTPGELFADRYLIKRRLGKGGMGTVWATHDNTLGEDVALKFLHTRQGSSRTDEWRGRLRDEVRAARQISHPGVCRVHDLGELESELYISMQLIDGPNLDERIRLEGPLPRAATKRLARELTCALASIHDRGLLHRDLKPANVLFDTGGRALISDFGLAVALDAESLSGSEARSGTRIYMAPEVLDGAPPSIASDLFALGLVLFEAVTGRRAFRTPTAILEAARRGRGSVPPSTLVDDVDPVVERLILRCLSLRREDRPKSAGELARVLEIGDPLDAVLALGEQPSPEVISSSRTRGLLTTKSGLLVILLTWALLFLSTLWAPKETPGRLPAESPATIALRARARLDEALDLGPRLAFEYARFLDLHELETLERHASVPPSADSCGVALRESAFALAPVSINTLLTSSGRVQPDDPPPSLIPGRVLLCDLGGRPLLFRDSTPHDGPPGEFTEKQLAGLLQALELGELSDFSPGTPISSRLNGGGLHLATRTAWVAPSPGPRLELATQGSRVLAFDVLWPAKKRLSSSLDDLVEIGVLLLLLLFGLPMSLRNLRAGRGDPFGAFRIALVIFFSISVGWSLGADWPRDLVGILLHAAFATFLGLGAALMIWIFYMAAEPFIQREWPRCLITWNRLLRGKLRDPVVASHVLIGMAVAALEMSLDSSAARALNLDEGSSLTFGSNVFNLLGGLTSAPFFALIDPMQFVTGLAVMGWLLRSRWLGIVPVFLLALAMNGAETRAELLLAAAIVVVDLILVLRYGLLALVANAALFALFTRLPLTFNPSPWTKTAALFALASLLLLHAFSLLSLKRSYEVRQPGG